MPLTESEELELLELEKSKSSIMESGESSSIGEFWRGIKRGSTFGMAGKEESQMEGSFFEPSTQKYSRMAGKAVGLAIPLVASEITGGAALEMGAAARGAGIIGKSVASGFGTGLTYEAAKGASQNKSVLETGKSMAKTGSEFAGLSLGGQALGYLRKVLGENLSESLANHFINTQRKIEEKLVEQGKPSLGKQYLEKTDLPGFKSQKETLEKSNYELGRLENQIGGKLESHTERLKTANVPQTKIEGTPQLAYSPTEIIQQTEQAAKFPQMKLRPQYTEDPQLAVLPAKEMETTSHSGGFGGGTFIKQSPEEIISESKRARELHRFAADRYGLEQPDEKLFASTREGVIEAKDVASTLDSIAERYKTGTRRGEVAKIQRLKENFLNDNPSRLTIQEAMGLKRKLDDSASGSHLKLSDQKTAISAEVDEALADKLREKIYKIDPELGEMSAKESLLIRINTGLKKDISNVGGELFHHGWWNKMADLFIKKGGGNLASKVLDRSLGTPSKYIAPAVRRSARIGLAVRNENK